ncbi:MAG: peptidase M55, partial [Ruminococcaceae bacterium]|nr:peptidase M55 [Oscillospiraceae bacterium]
MNVLIMTDLEGVSGVELKEQVHDTKSAGYRFACERLMADTNAAVEGAKRAGADVVYVVDGHGGGKNFIDSKLDPRATKVSVSEFGEMLEDVQIDAYLQIGAHAMPHTPKAFLSHVMSSARWYNYRINGVCYGEIAMSALYAGMHGVPCVMVSGDTAACT